MFVFALATHDGVFGSQALQHLALGIQFVLQLGHLSFVVGLQAFYLAFLAIDNLQLMTDITTDMRLLDIVAQMDGFEE